jgi:hypothetical protein
MNLALLPSASVVLFTLLALFAAARPACADGAAPRHAEQTLDALLMAPEGENPASPNLPTHLNLWSVPETSVESDRLQAISLGDFFPQGRQPHATPVIDFDHFEYGGFLGVADFSSRFKANATWVAGLSARVPVPVIPGNWGIFAEGFASYISRDIPFYYKNKSGIWFGGELGGDYTFVRDDIWFLRAQAGILYAYWGGVNALDNGIGVLGGAELGFYWIKHNPHAVVTFNPQLTYDGKNWIGLFSIGLGYQF